MSSSFSEMPFSLALGAGGARGLAHIHIIEALDELGIRPNAIAGSSIGAVIGACYAAGVAGKDIREFVLDLVSKRAFLATTLIAVRVGRFRDMTTLGNPLLLDGEKLLERLWPSVVPQDFEALDIPLSIVTTDFHARGPLILTSGPLLPAVAASMAIPGAFQPVEYRERILVDGGTVDPLPFDLLEEQPGITIAIDVTGGPVGEIKGRLTGFEVMFGSLQLLQGAIISEKLKLIRPEILIRPPIDNFRVLDFFAAKKVLDISEPVKDELKRKLEAILLEKAVKTVM
jgi:Predicted esterase of the alpha-beta hydrolase superfamily